MLRWSEDDGVFLRIYAQDVEFFRRRNTETFMLPDGIMNDACMTSENMSLLVREIAG